MAERDTTETVLKDKTAEEITAGVSSWLARLVLLYGVPFQYLIPEQEMLLPESIRFFYLDPIWIQCLVQGACSVGNTDYGDTLIDKAMNFVVQPDQKLSVTSQAAASVRDRLREQYEGIPVPAQSQELAWPLMGFLLRSSVVTGWRGLEIMAYRAFRDGADRDQWKAKQLNDDDKKKVDEGFAPLQALRIEQLSADVMLGIFNGIIAQWVIRQPHESLHFGLTRNGNSFFKSLRNLGFKDEKQAGQIFGKPIEVNKLMRDQPQQGVIKVADLAAEMRIQLKDELLESKFTSAEFAVEMIEAAGEFTFTLKELAA